MTMMKMGYSNNNHSGKNTNNTTTTNKDSTVNTYYGSDFTVSSSSFDEDSDGEDEDDEDEDEDHHHHHHRESNNSNYVSKNYKSNDYSSALVCSTTTTINTPNGGGGDDNRSSSSITVNNIIGLGKRKRRLRHRRHDNEDHEDDDDHDDDHEDARKHGSSSGRRVRHRGRGRQGRGGRDQPRRNNGNDESYFSTTLLLLSQFKKNTTPFCCRRPKKTKTKKKKTKNLSKYINPQIVFLILAGIGWTIVQLDFLVLPSSSTTNNTPPPPPSSSSSSSLVSAGNENENENENDGRVRYLRYHTTTTTTTALDQAEAASSFESVHDDDDSNDDDDDDISIKSKAASSSILTGRQKHELEDKRHNAFLLRRQRLQNEINTTLFSVDDFVRISSLFNLDGDDNSTTTTTTTTSRTTSMKIDPDLKPVLRILQNAGYKFLDHDTLQMLPTWTDIVGLYGQEPKIYGLETCQKYRDTVPWELRSLGPAGSFNTGTNLLSTLVASNCKMDPPPGKSIARFLWQSPWGKHIPSKFVHNHTHTPKLGMKVSKYNNTLAVVTTRDPLTWIVSMCAQHYAAYYVHSRKKCPNLVPYESDLQRYHFKTPNNHRRPVKLKYTPVNVKYSDEMIVHHRSMADMWNDFYGDYVSLPIDGEESSGSSSSSDTSINEKDVEQPSLPGRIIVRLEDLIFHAEKVVPQICECMGATYHPDGTDGNILLISETANQNEGVQDLDSTITGILRTIIKYGTPSKRLEKFQDMQQLEAAKKLLNGTLMDLFGYPAVPDIPSQS